MLKEEQAAELVKRCEAIAGRPLPMLRGNLQRSQTRSAALWEMLVVDAASRIGRVEYEAPEGGPDVHLRLPSGRSVWIEVTYIHPRFARQERQSHTVSNWIRDEAVRRGFGHLRVGCQFYGDPKNPAGPVRTLPHEHERTEFLSDPQVEAFFGSLGSLPSAGRRVKLKRWTVLLNATPAGSKDAARGSAIQEAPKTPYEHAAYRALKAKRRQHQVPGPRLVCIGSDTSSALSPMAGGQPFRMDHVLGAALSKSGALSGVIVVDIAYRATDFMGMDWAPNAWPTIYPVADHATAQPLTADEWNFLSKLNFNHWRFTRPLDALDKSMRPGTQRVGGKSTIAFGEETVKLTISGTLLVEILAGRTNLVEAWSIPGDPPDWRMTKLLDGNLKVSGVSLSPGDIERGAAEVVELTLTPSHERVFQRQPKMSSSSGEEPTK